MLRRTVLSAALLLLTVCRSPAQEPRGPEPGDTVKDPGPLATDLSGSIATASIERAMRRVGDWQLARIAGKLSQDWTYATLYDGLLAAGAALRDPQYRLAVQQVGEHFGWTLGPRELHADDQAIGKSYLALRAGSSDTADADLAPLTAQFNHILALPEDASRPTWWWCDAL